MDSQKRQSPAGTGLRDYELLAGKKYTPRLATVNSTDPLGRLLARLDGVREAGNGHVAHCPAHADRSPSLSVTQGSNGAVLIHCFGGCDPASVLAAVGLDLADLFPGRIRDESPEGRRIARREAVQAGWAAALGVLARESTLVAIAAETLRHGETLSAADVERVHVAANRIQDVREVLAP